MSAPDLLDDIKQDLGITDDASDAWLQRRIEGIWARMEVYTSRALCAPPQAFVDDWGQIASSVVAVMPPVLWEAPRGSVFLRCFPVASIESVEINGETVDGSGVSFDWRTGKLFSIRPTVWAEDLSRALRDAQARITYKAGWAQVPADLYEIVLGSILPQWQAKQAGGAGGAGTVNSINVVDVGTVELGQGTSFVQSTLKGVRVEDPLLGPYANMLDLYIDHRVRIGNAGQPTTTPVDPEPAP